MLRLLLVFCVILCCAFTSAQTFESYRITKGETAWIQTNAKETFERTHYTGAYVAAARARGVNGFGLTYVDDAWQKAGFTNVDFPGKSADLFTLSLNIDLIIASGGYVVLRHQPWAFYGHEWLKNPALLLPPLQELARMLKGKNLKRVALQLFGEPGALSTLDANGIPQPLPADVWEGELLVRTALLEDAYTYCIAELRKIVPDMTFILAPVGWAHLVEGKFWMSKFSKTLRAYDVYHMPADAIEKAIQERYDFHKARGEKMIFMEAGIADRSKVGTLEEKVVVDRIRASAAALKIPVFWWVQAGT